MASRYTRGYRAHRGRRRRGSLVLKIIVVILAVLLLAGILFAGFLGKYVRYTDHGVRIELPWGEQASAPPAASDPVIIVTQSPAPEPTPSAAALEQLQAVEVTAAQLADGSALQVVRDAGGNALVVEMKGADGRLAWPAQVSLAAELGAVGADTGVVQAVTELARTGELYLVARVSCFRDQVLSDARIGGPLMTQGGNVWYDPAGYRWVSPVSQEVTAYLADLCGEIAAMGFDEIVLECAGFPGQGETGVLAVTETRPEDRTGPVASFLQQVTQKLEGTDTVLSLQVDGDTALGEEALTGLTPALLAQYAFRVWVELPETELTAVTQALTQAGMDQAGERLVLLGGSGTQGSWSAPAGQVQ